MNKLDKLAKALSNAPNNNKTQPYDTTAVVKRIEGGMAWVQIPGGVEETPATLAINAKAGDEVRVRVTGGKAYIMGNSTSPPTDDSLAKKAQADAIRATKAAETASAAANSATKDANTARISAESAAADAATARTAAADAKDTADAVHGIAVQAQSDAEIAKDSAENASEYAARALGNLSTVQSVAETLAWITAHGTMTLTSDTALDPTHVYFVADQNGDYTVGGNKYSIVTEPDVDDIATYYELTIDESLNNYVGTHLALTSEGLWLIPEDNATPSISSKKVLIAVGGQGHTYSEAGTYIIEKVNGSDTVVAKFTANGAQIGQDGQTRILQDYHSMQMIDKEGDPYLYVSDLRDKNNNYKYTGYYDDYHYDNDEVAIPYVNITITKIVMHTEDQWGEDSPEEILVSDCTIRVYQDTAITGVTLPGAYSEIIYVHVEFESSSPTMKAYTFGYDRQGTLGPLSLMEGYRNSVTGVYSHGEGFGTTSEFTATHAEGISTHSQGAGSHAEGYNSVASYGLGTHSEGEGTSALGDGAHAEGGDSHAHVEYSHAEGRKSIAYNFAAHAEGFNTHADGYISHAEGASTKATGSHSHAQNYGTIAGTDDQTVIGRYNEATITGHPRANIYTYDTGNYAFVIGNGSYDDNTDTETRSNALTVDWKGGIEMYLDHNGSSSSAATSGADKDLFNAIRSLGWYSDVIV